MSSPTSPRSFEEHRQQFLKILGLSPSTTRIPNATPPPSSTEQEIENNLWTFVGGGEEEGTQNSKKQQELFTTSRFLFGNAARHNDHRVDGDDYNSHNNISTVERFVSRSVDQLLLPTHASSLNSENNKHRTLLNLSPSRALSKSEFASNQTNGKRSSSTPTSNNNNIRKQQKKPGLNSTPSNRGQMKNNNSEIISSTVEASKIRGIAFRSPSRWKHTSNFDIHSFLPTNTEINFSDEESKALQKILSSQVAEENHKNSKEDEFEDADKASNASSQSASSSSTSLNEVEVVTSLLEAGQLIKKLVRALKIQREANSTLSKAKSNSNPVPASLSNAEEFLQQFSNRYSYLYLKSDTEDEVAKNMELKKLRAQVVNLQKERKVLTEKIVSLQESSTAMMMTINNNNNSRRDTATSNFLNAGNVHNQNYNNNQIPHYALPKPKTPVLNSAKSFSFSSAKQPTANSTATAITSSALQQLNNHVPNNNSNNNTSTQQQQLKRYSSNLSALSGVSGLTNGSSSARPKKGVAMATQHDHENTSPPQAPLGRAATNIFTNDDNQHNHPHMSSVDQSEGFTLNIVVDCNEDTEQKHKKSKKMRNNDKHADDGFGTILDSGDDDDEDDDDANSTGSHKEPTETATHSVQHKTQKHEPIEKNSGVNRVIISTDHEIDEHQQVGTLRKMNRELQDLLEIVTKERNEYQTQLTDAVKQLVCVDSASVKNASTARIAASKAIETLMEQVKFLTERNATLEETMIAHGIVVPASLKRNNNNKTNDHELHLQQNNNHRSASESTTASNQKAGSRFTKTTTTLPSTSKFGVSSTTITSPSKKTNLATNPFAAADPSSLRSASSVTVVSVQSSTTENFEKRSPMALKSTNPKVGTSGNKNVDSHKQLFGGPATSSFGGGNNIVPTIMLTNNNHRGASVCSSMSSNSNHAVEGEGFFSPEPTPPV